MRFIASIAAIALQAANKSATGNGVFPCRPPAAGAPAGAAFAICRPGSRSGGPHGCGYWICDRPRYNKCILLYTHNIDIAILTYFNRYSRIYDLYIYIPGILTAPRWGKSDESSDCTALDLVEIDGLHVHQNSLCRTCYATSGECTLKLMCRFQTFQTCLMNRLGPCT